MRDFVILELEKTAGGNSRSGENEVSRYPWGAHYVPVPGPGATLVRELFTDLGVLKDGAWDERHLCFAPQERLFHHGQWHAEVLPTFAIDKVGQAQFHRFDQLVSEARGTGEFTLPMDEGARARSLLDRATMAQWMEDAGLTSPALRWYVDYTCRDDYGARAQAVSAWAGLHYFASRELADNGPLTWPEGNGWIVRQLAGRMGARLRVNEPAHHIERVGSRWRVRAGARLYDADTVIYSAPTLTAPYLVDELRQRRVGFEYSPWLTANLTLDRWPRERPDGAAPSWDNVIYGSPALGYVVATHQSLSTQLAPTVWTYYWSLADVTPRDARTMLQTRSWEFWRDAILDDLARAHPDIRECVSRIDVMRMGHAMVRPTPGFLSAPERQSRWAPERLFLANSDVSGLSLFEEAQHRGVAAARRALLAIGGQDSTPA